MEEKLKGLIDSSERIFITSHIGPDGDSISSSLLLYKILKDNYSDKNIMVAMEEQAYGLDFLDGYSEIKFARLSRSLEDFNPDLLFVLDANNVNRITRYPDEVREYLKNVNTKIIIIDHHEPNDIESNELYINNSSPAVTLDIYEIFLQKLGFKKPQGYEQIAITGIYTDTGGFVNRNLNYIKTFEVVPKLIADGADIEKVVINIKKISEQGIQILKEFINNMTFEDEYTYTYLSDATSDADENIEAIKQASDIVRTELLRNVEKHAWGFILYKDVLAPGNIYSVSFRAASSGRDVSKIAIKLGGGGHKPAAGAKFEADSMEQALLKVKDAIASSLILADS